MAGEPAGAGAGASAGPELDQEKYDAAENVKIICLGDSAVGKSKLMERFLMDGFRPQQLSTYALTLYKYTTTVDGKTILVDFWDTAGQERFQSMHASYYHKAHACIMVFDVQRKVTYKNLSTWYSELREFRPEIPCVVVANKIDADANVTQKSFNFARRFSLPLYFVSAADGTNVVKTRLLFSPSSSMMPSVWQFLTNRIPKTSWMKFCRSLRTLSWRRKWDPNWTQDRVKPSGILRLPESPSALLSPHNPSTLGGWTFPKQPGAHHPNLAASPMPAPSCSSLPLTRTQPSQHWDMEEEHRDPNPKGMEEGQ
ncbi:rab-like protein 2A isoform X3 [Notamacropus eugenii]|uniref:rab-like protein 2A isoform X3 n=1 Tax=Notamacropus eugenii TaxID=9315 RepID=UPI003B6746EF